MKWENEDNKNRWVLRHNGKYIGEIVKDSRNFRYLLPVSWFPRTEKNHKPQSTKTLEKAKKKCEKWIYKICKSILKSKP